MSAGAFNCNAIRTHCLTFITQNEAQSMALNGELGNNYLGRKLMEDV
jgi:hypothetical protein